MKVGYDQVNRIRNVSSKSYTEELDVEENEQVIGIKAQTWSDPTGRGLGCLQNLQFKIGKLI